MLSDSRVLSRTGMLISLISLLSNDVFSLCFTSDQFGELMEEERFDYEGLLSRNLPEVSEERDADGGWHPSRPRSRRSFLPESSAVCPAARIGGCVSNRDCRTIHLRERIDLSRVRVIEHIHEMQHLSCLLSCEHRTKFLNMHNNPIHIGLESPAPGMIRAAALSKLDELADGSPMPTDAIRPRNPLALILGETGKHDGCTRRRPSRRPRVHCTYVGDTGTAGSHRP